MLQSGGHSKRKNTLFTILGFPAILSKTHSVAKAREVDKHLRMEEGSIQKPARGKQFVVIRRLAQLQLI